MVSKLGEEEDSNDEEDENAFGFREDCFCGCLEPFPLLDRVVLMSPCSLFSSLEAWNPFPFWNGLGLMLVVVNIV